MTRLDDTENVDTENVDTDQTTRSRRRKTWFIRLIALIVISGVAWFAYWILQGSNIVSTDNAYTATEISQITSAVEGTVKDVKVTDTETVALGDILLIIDDTDTRLALEQARAELEGATRRVQGYLVKNQDLTA